MPCGIGGHDSDDVGIEESAERRLVRAESLLAFAQCLLDRQPLGGGTYLRRHIDGAPHDSGNAAGFVAQDQSLIPDMEVMSVAMLDPVCCPEMISFTDCG